jgi:hypothetical protein
MADLLKVRNEIIRATFREVLPAKFDTPAAAIMLLAIGLQESRFDHRQQIGGPAHGFWQFERRGGVAGVLGHPSSKRYALAACAIRGVPATTDAVYTAIVQDDLLACAFARLLLWTDARALPAPADVEGSWQTYIRNWRPGRPHRTTWDALHAQSVAVLER